ncbi:porin [Burkholderia anthina]|uniref:porin n=1 Tax=Burkholderia anthina TaxID=179879 RepID=UPI001CF4E1B1|nr:porin [Burkholderia anthina]MCA8094842.1 porin [Burkholderia anthina]
MPPKPIRFKTHSRCQISSRVGDIRTLRVPRAWRQTAVLAGLGFATQGAIAGDTFLTHYIAGVPYAGPEAYTPGITLYGVVDEAIAYTKGAHTAFAALSSGEWTSKIGMYGAENLGDGYTVRFALEGGFNSTNGSLPSGQTLFNREAWVAIGSRRTGELKFGLQDDISIPLLTDVFGGVASDSSFAYLIGWAADLGPGASFEPGRTPNTLSYTSPWLGPLNAQIGVSFSNSGGDTAPQVATRAAAINYYDGHLFVTGSYWGNYGPNPLDASYVRTDNFAIGGFYDAKNFVIAAGYSFLAPRLAGNRVASTYTAGCLYKYLGRNDFRAQISYRTVNGVGDRSFGLTLGYDYDLSKMTALYVRGSLIRNVGAAPEYPGYKGSSQPILGSISDTYIGAEGVPETYKSPHMVLVGFYHKF